MPFDRSKYHPKWDLIGRLIRKRANYCCEFCGVADGFTGYWLKKRYWTELEIMYHLDKTGQDLFDRIPEGKKPWPVVLTVAHLDHNIDNNRFDNLRALCQVCHLSHDRTDNRLRRKYGPHGKHFLQFVINYESTDALLIREA